MKTIVRIILLIFGLASVTVAFMDKQRISDTRHRMLELTESPEDPSQNFQSMTVPVSIYELSSPVDYATQKTGSHESAEGVMHIDAHSHDKNYIQIAEDLKKYEDAYSACINHLSDNDFSDETVDDCVGINYNYVYDDIDYEKSKILARSDSALRDFMIQHCYTVAGVDLVLANACDLIESDAINLLWNELNFHSLIDYHRNKYLFEHSYMNETVFNPIITEFDAIHSETNSLLTELYDHRTLTITHLETLIADRTADIIKRYKNKQSHKEQEDKQNLEKNKALDEKKNNDKKEIRNLGLNGDKIDKSNLITIDIVPDGSYNNYSSHNHEGFDNRENSISNWKGVKQSHKYHGSPISRFLELNNRNLKRGSDKSPSVLSIEDLNAPTKEVETGKVVVDLNKNPTSLRSLLESQNLK